MSDMNRRSAFLDEIGLGPVWVRREGVIEFSDEAPEAIETVPQPVGGVALEVEAALQADVMRVVAESPIENELADGPSAWPDDGVLTTVPAPHVAVPTMASPQAMDWLQLQQAVAGCTACGLCHGRKNTVFGVGDNKAKWLFIGEGPGRNEDIQGEPFVGPAGKLLDNILLAMGLKRGENAYIANIVKCRPTDGTGRDRPPSPEEVAACLPYLQRQIELIQPTVLVALGKTAALSLLGLDAATPVSKLRGSVHRYADRPLIVTYHPAYLLRQLGDKGKVWADLSLAMSTYAQAGD
ncbi:uracil-DNA glycosylase, 4 family protein [Collimonas arenae]|uniref:Type-4 uracil-DNA glycosylase n=1 Tax=Collimonas arenae TaxID=279058 RepID=A0A127QI42_9BURK|nr:uracil-DNA glycosylase [Collimonas arenae]AMP09729.1 uracil-DNA glycosylase, 4 family protein [Collimonas arenae]